MATLTAGEAARRLGVKVETLYAYVSRGSLHSFRPGNGRSSRFDAREVEALARRGRPRRSTRAPALDLRVETTITEIGDHRFRYRGHDVVSLAHRCTYEQVARLLWTGRLPSTHVPWDADVLAVPLVGSPIDRVRLAAALAGTRPWARTLPGPDLAAKLVATIVDAQPVLGDGRSPRLRLGPRTPLRATIAGRLATRLSPRRWSPAHVTLLNTALVLLADHELAASTLAARVAASARAGLPAVVGAGLGPLDGPLHGRASTVTRDFLDEAVQQGAATTVSSAVQRRERLPGFGHALYPQGDPRAVVLLHDLRAASPTARALRVVDDVVTCARDRAGVEPNVDFALAAMGLVLEMPNDAGELVFAVARLAGWLAHAMEEQGEVPLRFRARAVYVGSAGSSTSQRNRSS